MNVLKMMAYRISSYSLVDIFADTFYQEAYIPRAFFHGFIILWFGLHEDMKEGQRGGVLSLCFVQIFTLFSE